MKSLSSVFLLAFRYDHKMGWAVINVFPTEVEAVKAQHRISVFMRPETQFEIQELK